ncbi:MAG: D-alanine--D-alanine ligase [Armatimonadetes bacterium]|nr:D-alanine--D-alanine ligase [Armatimonadota bacterium]
MKKIRVGILFGGRSCEHEVSLVSARSILDALDRGRYDPVLIGIDKEGKWFLQEEAELMLPPSVRSFSLSERGEPVVLLPVPSSDNLVLRRSNARALPRLDVVFPVLHGTCGEDGSIQGLLEMCGVPYVGAGIAGSAISFDKDVTKRLLREAGLPVAPAMAVRKHEWEKNPESTLTAVLERLGPPLFVKPANQGSSVGVSKVKGKEDLARALTLAFRFDEKAMVEKAILAREIECSVLGGGEPIASRCGEVIPQHEFYSYEAKYLDENGAILEIPAPITTDLEERIRTLAVSAFKALECDGMARVDFFIDKDTEEIYVNELNTIPGFTHISMYPKLWEYSGISYPELIDRLLTLALERHNRKAELETSFQLPTPPLPRQPVP